MMHAMTGLSKDGEVIDYFFSPSSPWTYLGHARFAALAAKFRVRVNVKPIDLVNRVFPATGGLPVAHRPKQRLAYRETELLRWSEYLAIKLNLNPRWFPVSCDLASKVIISTDMSFGSRKALDLVGLMLAGVWAYERDIADPDTLLEMASSVGVDTTGLLERASQNEVINRYAEYTQEAIDRQVFGAPFYIYRNKPFWGQDRLDFIERALKENT